MKTTLDLPEDLVCEIKLTAVRERRQRATPVFFQRQRRLLALLDALGGSVGNLDFQKLLFLYCQEPDSGSPYEFVPYKFGAFSFTSYADRRNAHVG